MNHDAQDLAIALRASAERLVPPFVAFEAACLDAGMRLGEAMPGLGRLAESFGSVADLLQGPAMTAASRDLESIVRELARMAETLDDEGRGLDEIIRLDETAGSRVEPLQALVRTVAALVFTLKVESAQLPSQSQEMIAFAVTLQEHAEHARASLKDFHATQSRLDATLRSAAAAQEAFESRHRGVLAGAAAEIGAGLGAIARRRAQTAAALAGVGSLSKAIGERIGACVVGLQVADATRQRVEHVAFALNFAADALERGQPGLAARTLALQCRQAEATRSELTVETETIAASFAALAVDANDLRDRSRQVFGQGEEAGGSFLEAIGGQLSTARACLEEGLKARAHVEAAKDAFAAEMAQLKARAAGLSKIADDVSMIGVNASLRSTRLGEAGRGVTVIAAELREFGRGICAGIADLSRGLESVVACVDRFSLAQREIGVAQSTELGRRMAGALAIFDECGGRMSEALAALGAEAGRAQEALDPATQALSTHASVGLGLDAAAREIGGFAQGLGGGGVAAADIDHALDEALRPIYSMAAERRVHDELLGRSPPSIAEPADMAEAFML